MRVGVKICGVTSRDAIVAAASAGADAVGIVLAESPRHVELARAERLLREVPAGMLAVAVFGDRIDADWRALESAGFDVVQADAGALVCGSDAGIPFLPVVRDAAGAEALISRLPRLFVFEGRQSGCGVRADWTAAASLARRAPIVLAGGLDPVNVGAAIRRVRPAMVDVSSGVESRPGVKDRARILDFVAAVRAAERDISPGAHDR